MVERNEDSNRADATPRPSYLFPIVCGTLFGAYSASMTFGGTIALAGSFLFVLFVLVVGLYATIIAPRAFGFSLKEYLRLPPRRVAKHQSSALLRGVIIGLILLPFALLMLFVAQGLEVRQVYETLGPTLSAILAGFVGGPVAFGATRLSQIRLYRNLEKMRAAWKGDDSK